MTTPTPLRRLRASLTLALLLAGLIGTAAQALVAGDRHAATQVAAAQQQPTVATTEVVGAITPVIADHIGDTVDRAAEEGHEALIVLLDTPGGLVTSMRQIVQALLAAPLPVVVYVSPSGADAGSAGTFITLAANIAAMAPATTIGAATPVDLEGGEVGDKVVNNAAAYAEALAEARGRDVEFAVDSVREGRSITASEALDIGAIDLITPTVDELLDDIDGWTVTLGDGSEVTLATAGATTVPLEMSGTRRLLQRIADPNLAFIFLSIGTLAIIYEVANPGLGAGGIIGAVMLILAMFSLSVLPVNYAGALLMVLAAGLFIAELFIPGIGVGAAGGTVALLLGGLFLFQRPAGLGIDLWVLLPTVAVMFGLTLLAGRLVARSRRRPTIDATAIHVGREGVVRHDQRGRPRIQINGVWWWIRPEDGSDLPDGTRVTVIDHDNLELVVAPTGADADTSSADQ